jgi:hypothetical protein
MELSGRFGFKVVCYMTGCRCPLHLLGLLKYEVDDGGYQGGFGGCGGRWWWLACHGCCVECADGDWAVAVVHVWCFRNEVSVLVGLMQSCHSMHGVEGFMVAGTWMMRTQAATGHEAGLSCPVQPVL